MNDMTILEISRQLSVSKQSIRRYLQFVPAEFMYKAKQGNAEATYIRPEGVALIVARYNSTHNADQNANHNDTETVPEQAEQTETSSDTPTATERNIVVELMRERIADQKAEIELLRAQLAVKDQQIEDANARLSEALRLAAAAAVTPALEDGKRHFRLFGRKH